MAKIWTYDLFITMLSKWLFQKKTMKIIINLDGSGNMKVDVELKNLTALDMLTEAK
ncbi:MAG: hypothetical protein PHS93_08560 [Candidatus Omnitrophica bacterium]|jgi:hypothetical protein|nr:hypothetical protein [Candidatus Omnitrophota bacterium]